MVVVEEREKLRGLSACLDERESCPRSEMNVPAEDEGLTNPKTKK